FKSGDSVVGAAVMEPELAYLYPGGVFWHFLPNYTFEQISADEKAMGDNVKGLVDNYVFKFPLCIGNPLSLTTPNFVELEI
ncbi:elongation factor P, partial [Pseudoalteromonas phenolica]